MTDILEQVLNQDAVDWMSANNPELLYAIERKVKKEGMTPQEIRRAIVAHAGPSREDLAKRAELAALALVGE